MGQHAFRGTPEEVSPAQFLRLSRHPKGLIFERVATRFHAHGLQDLSQGTKPGEGTLKQIDADKGSEQEPIGTEELREDETDQHEASGESQNHAFKGHSFHLR